MAQEAFEQLTSEWTDIADIITVDASATYYIQNRGSDTLVACEGSAKPTRAIGVLVKPYEVLKYKKGTDNLYLRAFNTNCGINITSEA